MSGASYSYALKADSGYKSSMSGRITPEQHGAIVGILGNKDLGQQPAVAAQEPVARSIDETAAYQMGAKGAEPTEAERLLFEAWMRGHCWKVVGKWDGRSYTAPGERSGMPDPAAMLTRQLWAAWRDRAALAGNAAPPAAEQPDAVRKVLSSISRMARNEACREGTPAAGQLCTWDRIADMADEGLRALLGKEGE